MPAQGGTLHILHEGDANLILNATVELISHDGMISIIPAFNVVLCVENALECSFPTVLENSTMTTIATSPRKEIPFNT